MMRLPWNIVWVATFWIVLSVALFSCATPHRAAANPTPTTAPAAADNAVPGLDQCNVIWYSPSDDSSGSMPLGNGDIGANVWVEPDGDLRFYISKTDAWGDDIRGNYGMPKVGRVHINLDPNPFKRGEPFQQTLKLREGQIVIAAGSADASVVLTIWVDANNPVIHVETTAAHPIALRATLESYRTKPARGLNADTIFSDQKDRIAWCYRNLSQEPALTNLTFGALISGPGLAAVDRTTLKSPERKTHRVDITVLTSQSPTSDAYLLQLDKLAQTTAALDLEASRKAHLDWWRRFWNRSYIDLSGTPDADRVNQGYARQRFITGCTGRGAYPMKFNGSIFTADVTFVRDNRSQVFTADARDWGGQYWFQNTRAMYWPLLQTGDFDLMQPLFRMYQGEITHNAPLVKKFYGHDGSYIAETAPFWGGINQIKPEEPGNYTNRYYTPVLELSMMMLDYYEYTGDKALVRNTLVPVATAGLTFFDQHFPRDDKGKLLLDPDNSIEMYWKVRNPAPDIAGLHAVLPRLLALPEDLVDAATKEKWRKLLGELPELPIGSRKGAPTLLPMADGQNENATHNGENPELYAIYPFRLYGLKKPDLELALHTFNIRRQRNHGCWVQDLIQAAMLGLTDVAKTETILNLTRKDPNMRFPAFWEHANDYMPDEDNGGNGMNGLQQMLMQSEGRRILLLPAWPKEWNASFKLCAPFNTTVEGTVRNGKVEGLKVTPAERLKDVEIMEAAKP